PDALRPHVHTHTDTSTHTLRESLTHCVFFQAEDGIRDSSVTGVQTCALPISQISIVNHTFFKTLNTILSTLHTSSMPKPPCVQTEHTAIQMAKLPFQRLLCNLKSKL